MMSWENQETPQYAIQNKLLQPYEIDDQYHLKPIIYSLQVRHLLWVIIYDSSSIQILFSPGTNSQ